MWYDGESVDTVSTNWHIVTIVCLQLQHKISYEYQREFFSEVIFLEISWKITPDV